MHEPPKREHANAPGKQRPYDPTRAHQFVHKVPLWASGRSPDGYLGEILSGRFDQAVMLQDLNEPARGRYHPLLPLIPSSLAFANIRVHEVNIQPSSSFTEEGKQKLMRASEILEAAVKDGKKTAVTCDFGERRTRRALYLMHRRLGANHEEASRITGIEKSEGETLNELYETRIAKH